MVYSAVIAKGFCGGLRPIRLWHPVSDGPKIMYTKVPSFADTLGCGSALAKHLVRLLALSRPLLNLKMP